MNLDLMKSLKSAGRRRVADECVTDAELDELGLPNAREERKSSVTTSTLLSLKGRSSVERNCGTCVRWLNCTKLHAAHRVSPKLSACANYERKI